MKQEDKIHQKIEFYLKLHHELVTPLNSVYS